MTVGFVLLKSSGVCLQGTCEMTITVSTESPPSSYQFFDLKWPEKLVECPTSGISKQMLLVGSQYSWHFGKTCSKSTRVIFASSLWVKDYILIMTRRGCVGQGLFLASPTSDPQWESMGSAEPQVSTPFFQCMAKEVAAWRGWQVAWLGGAEPQHCLLGLTVSRGEGRAVVMPSRGQWWELCWGTGCWDICWAAFLHQEHWRMDFCSPHQTTVYFNLVYGLDFLFKILQSRKLKSLELF